MTSDNLVSPVGLHYPAAEGQIHRPGADSYENRRPLLPPAWTSDSVATDALSAFKQYADLISYLITDGIDACMSEFRRWQSCWQDADPKVRGQ